MARDACAVIGSGGHARVVIAALRASAPGSRPFMTSGPSDRAKPWTGPWCPGTARRA